MILNFSDRQIWAKSADLDQTAPRVEQSDQGLHCLPFHLHQLEVSPHGRTSKIKF